MKISEPVRERPLSEWGTIAVELLGAQSVIVPGERWDHHVIHKGDGPPLLMYHGIGGHAETYARTLPQIAAAGYHVYAVDALYHGYSSKPALLDPLEEMHRNQLDAAIDLIDALGYAKVHFEGESMGAAIGQHLALEHPDRIGKLILNGFGLMKTNRPMSDFKPALGPSMAALFPLSIAAVTDPTFENMADRLHWLVQDPDRITDEMIQLRRRLYQDPEINAAMRQVFGLDLPLPDWAARYANAISEDEVRAGWKSETLILWGDHNPGVGTDYGEYVAEAIDAKFYEFVGAGHWPQWEKPDEYAQVIIEFLNS